MHYHFHLYLPITVLSSQLCLDEKAQGTTHGHIHAPSALRKLMQEAQACKASLHCLRLRQTKQPTNNHPTDRQGKNNSLACTGLSV